MHLSDVNQNNISIPDLRNSIKSSPQPSRWNTIFTARNVDFGRMHVDFGRSKGRPFLIWVCHPNADSCKDLTPEQKYRLHGNEKKRMYERRVLEVKQASFTPLVFTTTGGMGHECEWRYHSRLAELISIKKGEDYAKTLTWIRGKVFFSTLKSALFCLQDSRSIRRRATNVKDIDVDVELARFRV